MLPLLLPLLPPLLLDHAERVLLVLAQVGVLRHDPLDQDGQHERPLVLQPTQLVEGRVADLRRKSIAHGNNSPYDLKTLPECPAECIKFTWLRSFHFQALTDLDEIFQCFDVLGLLLWVVALLGFVRQRFLRDHLPHVRVRDGRHEVIFDVVLG